MTITVYTVDALGVYVGPMEITAYQAVPAGSFTPPPQAPFVRLVAGEWVVLDAYPQHIPVPQTLTIRQAKLILLQNNLLDDVDAAVAQADRSTQIEWEYATEVHRTWPTLITMASALGMTDAQLDQLFIEGAKL